ncbi:MAG: YbaK/EbsC family protein [Cyanobacteria bacterium P01_E01_bin.45]
MSGKITPATRVVSRAGGLFQLYEYNVDTQSDEGYGVGAATSLGVEPKRVFKTLLVLVDGKTLGVAIIPAPAMLNLKAAAAALGGKKAAMAEPKVAEKATGYVVGGISPLGQKKRLKMTIDRTVQSYDRVIVSAGRRRLMMELASADLLELTGAMVKPLIR